MFSALARTTRGAAVALCGLALTAAPACPVKAQSARPGPAASPAPPDVERTFRPTVIVRHDGAQGSGTVIASVAGETLVLTASHVVGPPGSGPLTVELHRYNLGVEGKLPAEGWPVAWPAELAATDPSADVAVVRVRGQRPLPFVARLASAGHEPRRGTTVVSLGVDGGERLSSWVTRVVETSWFSMAADDPAASGPFRVEARPRGRWGEPAAAPVGRDERTFLLTARAPRSGRSGGGLFDTRGMLVGLCVGRIEGGVDRGRGLFASVESARALLREHRLDDAVSRSERLHAPAVARPVR